MPDASATASPSLPDDIDAPVNLDATTWRVLTSKHSLGFTFLLVFAALISND